MSQTKPISEIIKEALVARGWAIDETAQPNALGELRQFIHPTTLRRMAWLDAVLSEMDLDSFRRPARGLQKARRMP